MLDFIPDVCRDLNGSIKELYWILLLPVTGLVITLEFFKSKPPSAGEIVKRVALSALMLVSFDECMRAVALLSNEVSERIGGIAQLEILMNHLRDDYQKVEISWLRFKEAVVFLFGMASYVVAFLGIFIANILVKFTWSVLYVFSPLMILMFVSSATSFVTLNLYKGLISVAVWKVMWSILGVLLLKMAVDPEVQNLGNFVVTIAVNLCVGLSMLFVPTVAKSLLSSGMAGLASSLSVLSANKTGNVLGAVVKKPLRAISGANSGGNANSGMENFPKNRRRSANLRTRSYRKNPRRNASSRGGSYPRSPSPNADPKKGVSPKSPRRNASSGVKNSPVKNFPKNPGPDANQAANSPVNPVRSANSGVKNPGQNAPEKSVADAKGVENGQS